MIVTFIAFWQLIKGIKVHAGLELEEVLLGEGMEHGESPDPDDAESAESADGDSGDQDKTP